MIIEVSASIQNCPFCGAEAVAKRSTYDPLDKATAPTPMGEYYWIKCTNESCSVSPAASKTLDGAVEAWNRRA